VKFKAEFDFSQTIATFSQNEFSGRKLAALQFFQRQVLFLPEMSFWEESRFSPTFPTRNNFSSRNEFSGRKLAALDFHQLSQQETIFLPKTSFREESWLHWTFSPTFPMRNNFS